MASSRANNRYSEEFRESVRQRLLREEISIREAHRQYGVALATLYRWKTIGLKEIKRQETEKETMKMPELPPNASLFKMIQAVGFAEKLDEVAFGQYCRSEGLTSTQIKEWKRWFKNNEEVIPGHIYRQKDEECIGKTELLEQSRLHIKKQDSEIRKKDKALAKVGSMLLLSKKAQAIFGEKED